MYKLSPFCVLYLSLSTALPICLGKVDILSKTTVNAKDDSDTDTDPDDVIIFDFLILIDFY